jgi:hypothetical protein
MYRNLLAIDPIYYVIAVILPKTFATQMMAMFTRAMEKKNQPTRIFFSREEAIAWVQEKLERQPQATIK